MCKSPRYSVTLLDASRTLFLRNNVKAANCCLIYTATCGGEQLGKSVPEGAEGSVVQGGN